MYLDALREGLIETFVHAGCAVSAPTCGPRLGGDLRVLAAGERALSTANRNFRGRMSHPRSEAYLAGPAVAAASAGLGRPGVLAGAAPSSGLITAQVSRNSSKVIDFLENLRMASIGMMIRCPVVSSRITLRTSGSCATTTPWIAPI